MMDERKMLIRNMKALDSRYNPELQLLRSPFSSPGYHTTLTGVEWVHATRDSLNYALGLLDTELAEYETRALQVIARVISLQDTDPGRNTFGIWPWFCEEPLERMAPPDWNWADFCGSRLITALCRHGHRFPEELRAAVIRSVQYACEAIRKRNVGPDYTNIAILGTFVTLIYGERYAHQEFENYGLDRLTRLYEHTRRREVFEEYNSPVYTYIAILELSKLRGLTLNGKAREMCDKLLQMTWKTVAEHYHVATRQWSGPHARRYETLLDERSKAFLQLATQGRVMFYSWERLPYEEEWFGSGMACPPEYLDGFTLPDTRLITQWYRGDRGETSERWATTYITPQYSLGTFDESDFWNQRSVLLAYADNGGSPVYLRLRFLHDGYDFCSALFHSRQRRERVWFGVDFASNGGDTHINLDRIDGSMQAEDLRLRLELGGELAGADIREVKNGAVIQIGGLQFSFKSWLTLFVEESDPHQALFAEESDPYQALFAGESDPHQALFAGEPDPRQTFAWELNRAGANGTMTLDLVLYSGPRKTIALDRMKQAALVMSLAAGAETPNDSEMSPLIEREGELVKVTHRDFADGPPLYLHLRPRRI
ncbi:hypothetical protein NYE69_09935 [Paenibacillus sp. FSL R5-0527]|uniref:hypothetical protein n=1 Tax=Paenibacillus TaxID=44249 RepID=UPI00097B8206|nr:hypothetical protein [Paenibacillus macerans]OMG47158.1 hypothetical protein BK140_23325 [Paenibacillus macerans]